MSRRTPSIRIPFVKDPELQRALDILAKQFPVGSQNIADKTVEPKHLATGTITGFVTPAELAAAIAAAEAALKALSSAGAGFVTFAGGTDEATLEVAHGLTKAPSAVIPVFEDPLYVPGSLNYTGAKFTVKAKTSDGSKPAEGTKANFHWIAKL